MYINIHNYNYNYILYTGMYIISVTFIPGFWLSLVAITTSPRHRTLS